MHKIILTADNDARYVTVPCRSGHRKTVAVEETRLVLPEESFATSAQMVLDDIDESINRTQDYIADDDSLHSENVGDMCTEAYGPDFSCKTRLMYQQTTLLMTILVHLNSVDEHMFLFFSLTTTITLAALSNTCTEM